ncbi:ion transporter [Flavihumibacter sp. UBA7668]|uniref:ion transporter n=1 Tax=Flavihumibacter sp. UBA7668 TaxID=1946542 RepID=UPI0025B7C7B9|nr:ion transporter [Flavihumibacter sp. UBA7668]
MSWKTRLFEIIFEAETKAGRRFDLALLILIIISLAVVMLESMPTVAAQYGQELIISEWIITGLFTIEYMLRLLVVKKPARYARSFYGIVDLLSILPTYLSLLFPASHFLLSIRALRLMRVFRILKLTHFVSEGTGIVLAMKASARRIGIFLSFVLLLSTILGTIIYVVENTANPDFSSIPQSIYWAIVTITTVGYGDISPVTAIGKMVASVVMLLGYAIIAVPTGIVTVELSKQFGRKDKLTESCPACGHEGHDPDAKFCKFCGHAL